jgi:MFS family permease
MKAAIHALRGHDTSYEWKAVLLLSLGFGLVGLDRWMVAPLFPFMMKDLHLNYEQFGSIVGILGVAWGIASIFMGGLSDRVGRRKILLPAIVLFSLLSCLTGLATGFLSLIVVRAVMGVMEGSYIPASVAATGEASAPQRRGLNQGFMLSLFALLGLGCGPIIGTQLLAVVPSWRWVFFIVAIPGFILAAFMARVIRDPSLWRPRRARLRNITGSRSSATATCRLRCWQSSAR